MYNGSRYTATGKICSLHGEKKINEFIYSVFFEFVKK